MKSGNMMEVTWSVSRSSRGATTGGLGWSEKHRSVRCQNLQADYVPRQKIENF